MHAIQITEEIFTKVVSVDHVPGIIYFPFSKKAIVPGTHFIGKPGDWIIRTPSGRLHIMDDDLFRCTFE